MHTDDQPPEQPNTNSAFNCAPDSVIRLPPGWQMAGGIKWTRERPSVAGNYLLKFDGQHPIYVAQITPGQWERTQNPDWLYANHAWFEPQPVHEISGQWYGPIPQPDA